MFRLTNLLLIFLIVVVCLIELPNRANAHTVPNHSPTFSISQKNIIFISIDDLNMRVGYTGEHSQVQTPNIDRLAAQSVRFFNASADAPWCNPSRTALALSLRPSSSGVLSNIPEQKEWRTLFATADSTAQRNYGPGVENIRTMYGHFRDQGYFVSAIGKIHHDPNQQALELEEFDSFDQLYEVQHRIPLFPENAPLSGLQDLYYNVASGAVDWGAIEDIAVNGETNIFVEEDMWDYRIAETARTALSEIPTDQPFFLGIGFRLPHSPNYVPQRFLDLYDESVMGEPLEMPEVLENDRADTLFPGSGGLWGQYVFDIQENYEFYLQSYLASISFVDEQVGKVLDEIELLSLQDDTIVVLWSDHGYHNGEKQRNGKPSYWVEGIRIPMLFRVPGVQPKDVTEPANSIDIMPTLVDLTGLTMPTDFPRDGRSFARLVVDDDPIWRWDGFAQYRLYGEDDNGLEMAVYDKEWWYAEIDVEDVALGDEYAELYDMVNDPRQWVNLLHESVPDDPAVTVVADTFSLRAEGLARPNVPPVTSNQVVDLNGQPQLISLTATDINYDHIEFEITEFPTRGRLFQVNLDQSMGEEITVAQPIIANSTGNSADIYYLAGSQSETFDQFRYQITDGISSNSDTVTLQDLPELSFLPLLTQSSIQPVSSNEQVLLQRPRRAQDLLIRWQWGDAQWMQNNAGNPFNPHFAPIFADFDSH